MNISIKTIPHKEQRYDTCGDWWFTEEGDLEIRVSKLSEQESFLIGIHEAIEAYMCKSRGVSEESITEFDMEFEKSRKEGNTDEPGDSPEAPYRDQHFFATTIERLLAQKLDVDWKEYEEHVTSL